MKLSLIPLLLFVFVVLQSMAQINRKELAYSSELNENITTSNFIDSNKTVAPLFSANVFVRQANLIDYNFKYKSVYYTPAPLGGIGLMYNKLYFELGGLVDKNNNYGFSTALIYSIKGCNLDDEWGASLGFMLGEYTYFPAQQSNPDLWIYTAGLTYLIYYPRTWGTLSMGFLLGSSYMNELFSLNTRFMFNLAIPIFN